MTYWFQMSATNQKDWDGFGNFLKEKFVQSGLEGQEAGRKSESFNFWNRLGFSYDKLTSECKVHLAKLEGGECSEGDGFPQVSLSRIYGDLYWTYSRICGQGLILEEWN